MSQLKTILCIEDNADCSEIISFIFQNAGFKVTACDIPQEGIRFARTNKFAAIIMDFRLAELDGIDLCHIIRSFDSETPIIFYTGEARPQKKQAAMEAGAQAYLIKPNGFEKLEKTVTDLINKSAKEPQEDKKRKSLSFLSCKTYHPSRYI